MIPFQEHQSRVALIDSDAGRVYTYAEIDALQAKWHSEFPKERSLLFYFSTNLLLDVIAYLAGMESPHVVCLLDARLAPELKNSLIERYRPACVIEEGNLRKTGYPVEPLHPALKLLLSTSGTTGSPKMVRLSLQNVLSNARSIIEYLHIAPQEIAMATLPIHYSYGLSVLHSHLLAGASVVLSSSSIVQEDFWKAMSKYHCTSFAGVPHTYRVLQALQFEKMVLPALKTMTQAGGALEKELILEFHALMQKRKGKFFCMYGQTEATARIAYLDPKYLPEKAGSIGKAIPGGELDLEEGELIYRGPNVMLGYAENKDDLSQGDLLRGILRTGDLASRDAEGIYKLTGRLKRISKVYGYRLNLDELERLFKPHGSVILTSDDLRIFLHVEKGTPEQIEAYIKLLSEHTQLHYTTFEGKSVQTLPRTSSGKIDYTKL